MESIQENVQPISPEANIQQPATSQKKILRPGMMKGIRALAAVAVGVGSGMASQDAEAQQYSQYTYTTQGQQHVVVNGTKGLGKVLVDVGINAGLALTGVPVHVARGPDGKHIYDVNTSAVQAKVEKLLRGPMMKEPPIIKDEAVILLNRWNYEIAEGVIFDRANPNVRINIGPNTTQFHMGVNSNNTQVLITSKFLDQKKDQYGRVISENLVEQLVVIGENPTTGRIIPVVIKGPFLPR